MKLALVSLLVLTACAVQAQDVAGHYVLQGVMEVGSELLLKPDGTFEYMLAYGAADYWAKGTWKRDGNSVILHSTGKEEEPFRLLRSDAGKPGRIRVWVMGNNNKGVPNIHVGIKAGDEPLEATTDSDGAAVFPDTAKPKAVYFEVRVYQIEAGPFDVNPAHRDFYFQINGDAIMQVLFKDEALAINGGTLIMKHWDPEKPMRYVKE
jgi:hypothetical protein